MCIRDRVCPELKSLGGRALLGVVVAPDEDVRIGGGGAVGVTVTTRTGRDLALEGVAAGLQLVERQVEVVDADSALREQLLVRSEAGVDLGRVKAHLARLDLGDALLAVSECSLLAAALVIAEAARGAAVFGPLAALRLGCLLYTSDAADERSSVGLGGRRSLKKKKKRKYKKEMTKNRRERTM